MSLVLIDGFDGYGPPGSTSFNRMLSSGWSMTNVVASGGGGPNATTVDGIGYSLAVGNFAGFARSFNTVAGITLGFRWFDASNLEFKTILNLMKDTFVGPVINTVSLTVSPTGTLGLSIDGPTGLVIAHVFSPVNSVYNATWHYIEIQIIVSSGNLNAALRVDGGVVASYSGPVSTVWPGANIINFAPPPNVFIGEYIDDLYVISEDNTGLVGLQGDCVVHTMIPNSDAGPNQWSQYGGGITHTSAITGYPADETSQYLYSNVSGNEELFTISQLPSDIIDVIAIQVNARVKKDSAGAAKLELLLKSSTTLVNSIALTPPTSFLELHNVWETDPAGGSWTKTSAQAVEIGFKVV